MESRATPKSVIVSHSALRQHGCSNLRQSPYEPLTSMQQPCLLQYPSCSTCRQQRPMKGLDAVCRQHRASLGRVPLHAHARYASNRSSITQPCASDHPGVPSPHTASTDLCLLHAPDMRSDSTHCNLWHSPADAFTQQKLRTDRLSHPRAVLMVKWHISGSILLVYTGVKVFKPIDGLDVRCIALMGLPSRRVWRACALSSQPATSAAHSVLVASCSPNFAACATAVSGALKGSGHRFLAIG